MKSCSCSACVVVHLAGQTSRRKLDRAVPARRWPKRRRRRRRTPRTSEWGRRGRAGGNSVVVSVYRLNSLELELLLPRTSHVAPPLLLAGVCCCYSRGRHASALDELVPGRCVSYICNYPARPPLPQRKWFFKHKIAITSNL